MTCLKKMTNDSKRGWREKMKKKTLRWFVDKTTWRGDAWSGDKIWRWPTSVSNKECTVEHWYPTGKVFFIYSKNKLMGDSDKVFEFFVLLIKPILINFPSFCIWYLKHAYWHSFGLWCQEKDGEWEESGCLPQPAATVDCWATFRIQGT